MSGPSDPYRGAMLPCPACRSVSLREFHGRLCCDSCDGMMLPLDELSRAIHDLTGRAATYQFLDEAKGLRECPRCRAAMTTCKLRVTLEDELAKPRPELDRCDDHGLWFDVEELASVLAKVRSKVSPKGSTMGWAGDRSGFEWWKR